MLRISSGQFKGRKLKVPESIRPTEGVAREALFNILRPILEGSRVLDGYAGSGILGIEALSQGAKDATFVDVSTDSVLAIRDNLMSLEPDLPRSAWRLMHTSFTLAIPQLERLQLRYDIVILDPPYKTDEPQNALNCLASCAMLAPAATVVVEHHKGTELAGKYENLERIKQHRYGATVLSFYQAS